MTLAIEGLRVIDADTHLTEAHDLWTKRAPAKYADRGPHVVEVDGKPMWYVDGAELGFAGGGGVIDRRGGKGRAAEALFEWTQDEIHLGAFDIPARIDVMNDSGIHAQVCFPNSIGLGGQGISDIVKDPVLRLLCVQIYNDAMAEVQADSGQRLLPMPVLPAWDVRAAGAETQRGAPLDPPAPNLTRGPHARSV